MLLVTEFLSTQFKIKDLSSLSYFLGIQVTRTFAGLFITQQKYTNDILTEFNPLSSKSSLILVEQYHVLLQKSDSLFLQDMVRLQTFDWSFDLFDYLLS